MAVDMTGGCKLFIPRKTWQQASLDTDPSRFLLGEGVDPSLAAQIGRALTEMRKKGNQDELANYIAIEEWANNCAITGAAGGGMPTVVVAASNSAFPDRADFQADGVADEVTIQAAIDFVNDNTTAGNGRVVLAEGLYNLTGGIILDPGFTLEGVGSASRLSWSASGFSGTGISIPSGAGDTYVRSLRMDLSDSGTFVGIAVDTDNVYIDNIRFDGSDTGGERAIRISQTSAARYVRITENFFDGIGLEAITIRPNATDIQIVNNYFQSTEGIVLEGGSDILIASNIFRDSIQYGVNVPSGSDASIVLIVGNYIRNGTTGVRIDNPGLTERYSIISNYIQACTADGILVGGNAAQVNIIANTVRGCAGDGIELAATTASFQVNNCNIMANKCTGNTGFGVVVGGANANTNAVVGNDLRGNTAAVDGLADTGTGTITTWAGGGSTGDNL